MDDYPITHKKQPTFYFIGVSTSGSSINKIFPRWVAELGMPEVVLEGVDFKIHDEPVIYRAAVTQIKQDHLSLGALVTTHKIDIFDSASDLFDFLDPYALVTKEITCISKNGAILEGYGLEPHSSGKAMQAITGEGYFKKTGGQVLCFGAGGSAAGCLLQLREKKDRAERPAKFTVVNRSQGRLDRMKNMVAGYHTDIAVEYICNQDPVVNDHLMGQLPAGSFVINATGMGKDTPGSPITDSGLFPEKGIAWDFNYRGELLFLQQAARQQKSRSLIVEDGWIYFLHGWLLVMSHVLHFELSQALFERLAAAAEFARVRK